MLHDDFFISAEGALEWEDSAREREHKSSGGYGDAYEVMCRAAGTSAFFRNEPAHRWVL
jgi:hypothetical protein